MFCKSREYHKVDHYLWIPYFWIHLLTKFICNPQIHTHCDFISHMIQRCTGESCKIFESLYSLLRSNKVLFCRQLSYCKQVSLVYLVPLVFAFLCLWLVNSLFTVAPMHSDEGLASVSNCKRMVLCLTEKTCVLDVLLSVRCYGATSSMLISWQWIHPEKGKVKSLNTVRLTQEVLNKHLSCKKQLWKGGKVANFVHSWDHN